MSAQRYTFCLLFILITGIVFRLSFLTSNPPGEFRDEIEKAYHAWSIRHYDGITLEEESYPFYITVEGATTSAVCHYAMALFQPKDHPSVLSGRYVMAITGILTILSLWLMLFTQYKSVHTLWAAIACCYAPWNVLFSRWIAQGLFMVCFFSFFLLFIHLFERDRKNYWLFLAGIAAGLSMYSYAIAKLFIPLALLGLLICYYKKYTFKNWLILSTGFLILFIPVTDFHLNQMAAASERFNRISVFSTAHPVLQFLKNYMSHFNPIRLFITGDSNIRHSYPGMGMFSGISVPFFVLGLWTCIRKRKQPFYRYILFLLLCAPIPASLTNEGIPHYLRAIIFLYIGQYLIGMGLIQFSKNTRRSLHIVFASLALLQFIYFTYNTMYRYPKISQFYWDGPYFKNMLRITQKLPKVLPIRIDPNIFYAKYQIGYYRALSPEMLRQTVQDELLMTKSVPAEEYYDICYRSPNIPRNYPGLLFQNNFYQIFHRKIRYNR